MMWIRGNALWLIAALMCVAIAGYAGSKFQVQFAAIFEKNTYQGEIAAIVACGKSKDLVECARPHVHAAMELNSTGTIINDVASSKLLQYQCHYVLHLVGQELFDRSGDVESAVRQCSAACNSACSHGAIGEAFKRALGQNDNYDYEHLSTNELLDLGKKLCNDSHGICHGVGHALLIASGNVDGALNKCGQVATGVPLDYCYRGVYMEYGDQLGNFSLWQEPYPALFPKTSGLGSYCLRKSTAEMKACFNYFPQIVAQAYHNEGVDEPLEQTLYTRVAPICRSLSDPSRRGACIFGLGTYLIEKLKIDPIDTIHVCTDRFATFDDRSWCVAGALSLAIEYHQYKKMMLACTSFDDQKLRDTCYRIFFEKIETYGTSIDAMKKLCPAEAQSCLDSAEAARRGELHEFF